MPKTIYRLQTGSTEEWIVVNDDGTVTHHIQNAPWVADTSGVMHREETLPADQAKDKWGHSEAIDRALKELRR
jgi:hypothetical protein